MKKRPDLIYFICIGLFCLFALFFFSLPGYRFSGIVCLGISGIILLYYLFWKFQRPIFRLFRRILSILLILGILAAGITGIFIGRAAAGTEEEPCDYVIVLGAAVHGRVPSLSLKERLVAARDYLQAHPDAVCVVSGGKGSGELITEAACMYDWLTEQGIHPDRILQEDKATSTRENLAFSLALIEAETGTRPQKIGIVSSEYHLYRASLLARSQGLSSVLVPATTTWVSLRINYFLREIVALWYYFILGG